MDLYQIRYFLAIAETSSFTKNEEWVISLIQFGLGISIMPVWSELNNINYVSIADVNLERIIGLKWRSQQESQVVDWFRIFASSHDWQI